MLAWDGIKRVLVSMCGIWHGGIFVFYYKPIFA